MSMYRFCGAYTEIGAIRLKKFGQPVELSDALASDVILGGGTIAPADHPAWKDFTEQELSIYGDPLSHGEANAAFLAKKKRVQIACAEIRARIETGGTLKAAIAEAALPAK